MTSSVPMPDDLTEDQLHEMVEALSYQDKCRILRNAIFEAVCRYHATAGDDINFQSPWLIEEFWPESENSDDED